MDQASMPLMSFEPDVYIELNDVYTGQRKIARVDETGAAYFDLAAGEPTAFPIYAHLAPAEVGNILGWGLYLADHHPTEQPRFAALVDRLIASGQDPLTYNRAAHWAFTHHDYDYNRALAAGVAATAAVQAGRDSMDRTLASAGTAK